MYSLEANCQILAGKKHTIPWVIPLPNNSHYQDCYIFRFRGSQSKPSFATGNPGGGQPEPYLPIPAVKIPSAPLFVNVASEISPFRMQPMFNMTQVPKLEKISTSVCTSYWYRKTGNLDLRSYTFFWYDVY